MHRIFGLAAEAGLFLLIIGTPVALGSVHRPVILAASLLACATLVCVWLYRRSGKRPLRVPWFGGVLLALTAYTALQMVPLPPALLRLLAPATAEIYRVSLSGLSGANAWHPLSVDPSSTLWEVLKVGACTLGFLAGHNFLYRAQRRQRLLVGLVVTGVVLTGLGLAGAVLAPRQPLLFYTPGPGGGSGLITLSVVNPNHGAAFLVLCTAVAAGLALAAKDLQRRVLLTIASALLGIGVCLTLSRGGIAGLAVALGLISVASMLLQQRRESRRNTMATITGLLAVILGAAAWLAYEDLATEFSHLLPEGSADWSKVRLWSSGAAMIGANPWFGVGRGGFMTAFPRYLKEDLPNNIFSHMENQYLHLPAELGIPVGAGLILASVVALVYWLRKGHRGHGTLAVAAGLVAVAAHNLVDFNLELLGIAMPVAILAGLLSAGVNTRRGSKKRNKRLQAAVRNAVTLGSAAALLALTGWAALAAPAGPWEDEQRLRDLARTKAPLAQLRAAAQQAIRRHPADHIPHLAHARYAASKGKPEALASLNRALFLFPRSPQIHLDAARTLRRFRRRRQALLEYKLALVHGAKERTILREALPLCRTTRDVRSLLPPQVTAWATAADLLLARKRVAHAGAVVSEARGIWPHRDEVNRVQVKLLLARKDAARAQEVARKLVQANPSAASYLLWAAAARQAGGAAAEVEVLTSAIARHPANVGLAFQLSHANIRARDYGAARKVAEQILAGSQTTAVLIKAHTLLAQIHRLAGDNHRARYEADQARRLRRQQ